MFASICSSDANAPQVTEATMPPTEEDKALARVHGECRRLPAGASLANTAPCSLGGVSSSAFVALVGHPVETSYGVEAPPMTRTSSLARRRSALTRSCSRAGASAKLVAVNEVVTYDK